MQIYDQYLNFVSHDRTLFNLALNDSYTLLNSPKSNDELIESFIGTIASALFSVVMTMGVMPIIRSPRGNAAEMVAKRLEGRLRDYLMNSRNTASSTDPGSYANLTRPGILFFLIFLVLIILDRNIDLASMLNHGWTYSTMVHDLLDMKFNRVFVTVCDSIISYES
jgi:hypothetical protein